MTNLNTKSMRACSWVKLRCAGNARARILGLVVLLLVLTGASSAFAQATGSILGVVKDSSGGSVPGATVTIRNAENNQSRTAITGEDGAYRVPSLPVGHYTIRVEKSGFQTSTETGLTLEVAQELAVNSILQVGASSQEVTVTGEAPLVSTTTSSLGGLVNEQRMAELPLNGRNYLDLTLLQPGVTQHAYSSAAQPGQGGMLYSSNGAPYRSNDYLLDGTMLQNGPGGNGGSVIGNSLGVDGIREYRVITNNFSAEYGMTMGSQMVLVSKGGSNQFHGDVFEFLRNSSLDARNFFDLTPARLGHRIPEFRRNNFGGAGGGPIRKDKTFFFGVYEGLRQTLGTTNTSATLAAGCQGTAGQSIWNGVGTQPTGSIGNCPQIGGTTASATTIAPQMAPFLALYPAPNIPGTNNYGYVFKSPTQEDYGQMRVDQTFSINDNFFTRYTFDQANTVGPLNFDQFHQGLYSRNQYLTLSESHIFSTSMLNTARVSFSRTNLQSNSGTTLRGNQYLFSQNLPLPIDNQMGTIAVSGLQGLGTSGTAPKTNLMTVYAYGDDFNYTRGHHTLKFGAIADRYQLYIYTHGIDKGGATFANVGSFMTGALQTFTGIIPTPLLQRTYHWWVFGFYAQDDWRVTSRFTVNAGLRYEPTTTYNEIYGHSAAVRDLIHDTNTTIGPPFQNPSFRNLSPRVGFAWDVFGNGKMAIRSGFAELYDVAEFGSQLSFSGASMPPFEYTDIQQGGTLTVPFVYPAATSIPIVYRGHEYHLRQPHLMQYNLAIERQLPGSMALTVAYVGSRGMNLIQYKEGNPTLPNGIPQTVGGVTSCVAQPVGTVINYASQVDGSATSCWTAAAVRRNPAFGSMILDPGAADSFYNGLEIGLNSRITHGFQFQSSFTWSKLIDTQQAGTGSDNAAPHNSTDQDALHNSESRAPADFDIGKNWRFNAIYHLPKLTSSKGFQEKLLNGWWTSGIVTLETGYGMSTYLSSNRSASVVGSGSNIDHDDIIAGRSVYSLTHGVSTANAVNPCPTAGKPLHTPTLWFDPCAFTIQQPGFLGNSPRNFIRGPGLANFDFSLVKDTSARFLGESGSIQFRTEVFNALNRANFALPSTGVVYSGSGTAINGSPNGNAGQILRTIANARQIQFAIKIMF